MSVRGILRSAHADTSQPQPTYPRATDGSEGNSSALADLLHPWDMSQDLKMAPEPSEQTLTSVQSIKTINSVYRNGPRRLYDGVLAPVSVQALGASPVLSGTPRRCPRHPQTRPGALRRFPLGTRLRRRCRAGGHPTKPFRPRGVWSGPQGH